MSEKSRTDAEKADLFDILAGYVRDAYREQMQDFADEGLHDDSANEQAEAMAEVLEADDIIKMAQALLT